jgi:opacity protein-like surface antigen
MRNSRRLAIIPAVILLVWTAAAPGQALGQDPAQGKNRPAISSYTPPKLWERVEIVIFGGLGIPVAGWTTLQYTVSEGLPDLSVSADNRIKTSVPSRFFAGAAATFFLPSGVGLQAGFGYLKSGLTCENVFRYAAENSAPAAYAASQRGDGELTAVPVFFCLFNKFDLKLGKQTLRGHLAAGPAIFFSSVLADIAAGAAVVRDGKADAIIVPIKVADTTWISLGATAGIGLDIPLSRSLALALEGRYFYARRKNFRWQWEPGVYSGVFGALPSVDFSAQAASAYDRDTSFLTIDPSFVQVACGLKFIF